MTTENVTPVEMKKTSPRTGLVAGMILILIGLLALVQQFVKLEWTGMAFLPALGLIFITAGLLKKKVGFLIPGGILAGIGVGAILVETLPLSETATGAIFLLTFAGGWVLISLLSLIVHRMDVREEIAWWPFIPAGIMGLIGAAILIGGQALKVLELLGQGWPVILIVVGLYIILRRKQIQQD